MASGGWTGAGLEGQGEELGEASLCGQEGAMERPGRQSGWWRWASGGLTWLRLTRGSGPGEPEAQGCQGSGGQAWGPHFPPPGPR